MFKEMPQKFLEVLTLEEAMKTLEKWWKPRKKEDVVDLGQALGKVLAEDILAPMDLPPFDRAIYDGYALHAADTFGAGERSPVVLKVVGKIAAGDWPKKKLRRGECAEIATGAPLPPGADAVSMVENTIVEGSRVKIYRAVAPGENVAKKGSDVKKGYCVVSQGKLLSVREIGAIASLGIRRVKIFSWPKVAVISTGSELVEAGKALKPGKIYDANGPLIFHAIRCSGGTPVNLGIARDDPNDILLKLRKALRSADLVIISGGTSAGRGDIVASVVQEMGRPGLIVHGLAVKPGKPTFLAVIRGKPVFGLPGYPVSAFMVFNKIVAPYLEKMSGLRKVRQVIRAKLTAKIIPSRGRRSLIPVKLKKEEGHLLAEPLWKDSGAIASLSTADGYIDVPLGKEILEEGEPVEVYLF